MSVVLLYLELKQSCFCVVVAKVCTAMEMVRGEDERDVERGEW